MSSDAQLWIMVDIETSGPIIGTHSMTELGAAIGSRKEGLLDRFEVLIRPIGDAVQASRDSFEKAKTQGETPEAAMNRFDQWSKPWREKKALFIARPAAF